MGVIQKWNAGGKISSVVIVEGSSLECRRGFVPESTWVVSATKCERIYENCIVIAWENRVVIGGERVLSIESWCMATVFVGATPRNIRVVDASPSVTTTGDGRQIGRASCRERVCR